VHINVISVTIDSRICWVSRAMGMTAMYHLSKLYKEINATLESVITHLININTTTNKNAIKRSRTTTTTTKQSPCLDIETCSVNKWRCVARPGRPPVQMETRVMVVRHPSVCMHEQVNLGVTVD